jgi:hypothetical protein
MHANLGKTYKIKFSLSFKYNIQMFILNFNDMDLSFLAT